MRVWITKYALTQGVIEVAGATIVNNKYARGHSRNGAFFTSEFARDRKTANEMAEAKRKAKIASLKRQIAKLEKLRFG